MQDARRFGGDDVGRAGSGKVRAATRPPRLEVANWRSSQGTDCQHYGADVAGPDKLGLLRVGGQPLALNFQPHVLCPFRR